MKSFYILLAVISGAYLAVQLAVWLFFGKALFPSAGELFTERKSRVEWQTVFPKNLLRLVVFVFVGSVIGLLLDCAGIAGWITLPLAVIGALAFNFMLSTVLAPLYFRLIKSGEPRPEELEGMSGKVTEGIYPEGYGTISVRHGKRRYSFNAVSANGRELPEGVEIIVIYCQDGLCFVESEEHFYDILFESGRGTPAVNTDE